MTRRLYSVIVTLSHYFAQSEEVEVTVYAESDREAKELADKKAGNGNPDSIDASHTETDTDSITIIGITELRPEEPQRCEKTGELKLNEEPMRESGIQKGT